jgi:hypothetical protein
MIWVRMLKAAVLSERNLRKRDRDGVAGAIQVVPRRMKIQS